MSAICGCAPRPQLALPLTARHRAIFQSQYWGTKSHHVISAGIVHFGRQLAGVRGYSPRAGEDCAQIRKAKARERHHQAVAPQKAGGARGRQCRAGPDRPIRHLGRLYGNAERRKGMLRAGQAELVEDRAAKKAAQSGLRVRLHATGGKGRQRGLDHDRLHVEARF